MALPIIVVPDDTGLVENVPNRFDSTTYWPAFDLIFVGEVVELARRMLSAQKVTAFYTSVLGHWYEVPRASWAMPGCPRAIANDAPLEVIEDDGYSFHVLPIIQNDAFAEVFSGELSDDEKILEGAKDLQEKKGGHNTECLRQIISFYRQEALDFPEKKGVLKCPGLYSDDLEPGGSSGEARAIHRLRKRMPPKRMKE